MADTASSRGYAIGLQADYVTAKAVAAGAFKRLITMDDNTIDYNPTTQNDEGWSHGQNQATEQWLESHDARVQHSYAAYVEEMGRLLFLALGNYAVAAPGGGTVSKEHTFKPQDPSVSRQGKAVTYAETTGPGWNVLMPRAVADGISFKGDGNGVLTLDQGLQGAGLINAASTATWTGGTPSVSTPTDRVKFFNTQMALVATPSGESAVTYGCRYRSFSVDYKQSLLLDAGMKPGCAEYLVAGDPTSGLIRSACEFDKQTCDFNFEVDMATGSPELALIQSQKPINILLTATAGTIEAAIKRKLSILIPVAYYRSAKPTLKNGIYSFAISGSAFFDYVTSKMLEVKLINSTATYATGW